MSLPIRIYNWHYSYNNRYSTSCMDSSFSLARRCSANSSVLALSSCLSISSLSSTDMTTLGCSWNSGAIKKGSNKEKVAY